METKFFKSKMPQNLIQWEQSVRNCVSLMATECGHVYAGLKEPEQCLEEFTRLLNCFSRIMKRAPKHFGSEEEEEECRKFRNMMKDIAVLCCDAIHQIQVRVALD